METFLVLVGLFGLIGLLCKIDTGLDSAEWFDNEDIIRIGG